MQFTLLKKIYKFGFHSKLIRLIHPPAARIYPQMVPGVGTAHGQSFDDITSSFMGGWYKVSNKYDRSAIAT